MIQLNLIIFFRIVLFFVDFTLGTPYIPPQNSNRKAKSTNLTNKSMPNCACIQNEKILPKPVDGGQEMGYNNNDVRNRLIH